MKKEKTLAIVGCGVVAKKHFRAAKLLEKKGLLKLIAVVDPKKDVISDWQLTSDQEHYYSLAELLEARKVDIIAITTPSGTHYELAKMAILAGSHLLLEKPMCLFAKEAKELKDLAQTRGVKIALGHIYRYFPILGQMQEDLRAGKFGKVLYSDVKVRWGHDQAYYDQAAWRGTRDQDGGVMMNQSIHALDLMTWLMGKEAISVQAITLRQIHDMEMEDLGFAIFKMADNTLMGLEGTTNTDPQRPEASFFLRCSEGEFRAQLLAGKVSFQIIDSSGKNRGLKYFLASVKTAWQKLGLAGLRHLFKAHTWIYHDLILAIDEDREPLADANSGYLSVKMVEAIYQASSLGKSVEV